MRSIERAACARRAERPPRGQRDARPVRSVRITARRISGGPEWTVIELETGREHGPFDSEADVALCLAFEKLDRDEVEVLCDRSPLEAMIGWE